MNKDWTGNGNSIFKTLGASNHTDKERQVLDYYATQPVAIDKLAKAYPIPHKVWECAAGGGHLAKRLIELGHEVIATDIADRGYGISGIDFLMSQPIDCDCVLTNPPFKYSTEFIEHALHILPDKPCIMLLKTTALEGKGRFERLYKHGYLEAIYQFTERLLCAKNGDFDTMIKGGGSAVSYAWFVFRKDNKLKPIIEWI